VIHESGTDVPRNAALAFKWYSLAAAAGDAEAAARVEALVPRLSPEDLEAASTAATALKPEG